MNPKARRASSAATARARVLLEGDDAAATLEIYFAGRFTGSWFDAAGRPTDPATGVPLDPEPNRLTVEDLLALSLLDLPLDPAQMLSLFDLNRGLDHLLGSIDRQLELAAAPLAWEKSDRPWAAAAKAHKLLCTVPGVGRSRASRILARKRPHLIPVWDRYGAQALGLRGQGNDWAIVQDVVIAHLDRLHELADHLRSVHRDESRIQGLSLLRVLGIVVWMRSHGASLVDGGEALMVPAKRLSRMP